MAKKVSLRYSDAVVPYDGTSDFIEWERRYDAAAKIQGIAAETLLPLYLTGGAFAVYLGIPEEKKTSYEAVKKVLRSAFSPDAFQAYEEYASRRLNSGESVDVYFADLTRLAAAVDNDAISQQWLKCKFVAGLPDVVKIQLRAGCVLSDMTTEKVVEKARLLIATSETSFVSLTPKSVKAPLICHVCQQEGHTSRDCSVRRQPRIDRRCFVCGGKNHIASACWHRGDYGPKNE